ncbi:hypothetical protein ARMSODRAFT_973483 [Armillaria solidipes]|uniref:Uncharacterized protein n=1 Tax=Armillaria solidipes TaxID=1076256 RepID=A0A2H3C733_9AGAR|nr:hypothetical protein ARMSODRAFT_973483 [Armillaria solidipes]
MSIDEIRCKDDGTSFITTSTYSVHLRSLKALLSNKQTNSGNIHTFSPSCQAALKYQEQFMSGTWGVKNSYMFKCLIMLPRSLTIAKRDMDDKETGATMIKFELNGQTARDRVISDDHRIPPDALKNGYYSRLLKVTIHWHSYRDTVGVELYFAAFSASFEAKASASHCKMTLLMEETNYKHEMF